MPPRQNVTRYAVKRAFLARFVHSTIKKKKKRQKGEKYEQLLSRACLGEKPLSTHIRKFPLTKVPRHFHNIELDARRRASYVQANNSPSMSFKGCLPCGASSLQRSRSAARARQLHLQSARMHMPLLLRRATRRIERSASRITPNTRHIVPLLAVISTTGGAVICVIPRTRVIIPLANCIAARHAINNYLR